MYFEDIENPTEAQQKANQELADIIKQVQTLVGQAEKLAKKHKITFGLGLSGYGTFAPEDGGWTSSDVCW